MLGVNPLTNINNSLQEVLDALSLKKLKYIEIESTNSTAQHLDLANGTATYYPFIIFMTGASGAYGTRQFYVKNTSGACRVVFDFGKVIDLAVNEDKVFYTFDFQNYSTMTNFPCFKGYVIME